MRNKFELLQLLKCYDQYLDMEGKKYLNELINLDISFFQKNLLSKYNTIYLRGLSIYKEAALHNIIGKLQIKFNDENFILENKYEEFILKKDIDNILISILELIYNTDKNEDYFGLIILYNYELYKTSDLKELKDKIRILKNRSLNYKATAYEKITYTNELNILLKKEEEMTLIKNDSTKIEKIKLLNNINEKIKSYFEENNYENSGIKIKNMIKKI